MYIPIVLPEAYATPFDMPTLTSPAQGSFSNSGTILARRVVLSGRVGYAMGSGIAVAFISAFVLGVLARCVIQERRARRQARAHVEALAVQDRDYWGIDTAPYRRRSQRQEDGDEEEKQEETEHERQARERQEKRAREHGNFDSILERLERRALQGDNPKETNKGRETKNRETQGRSEGVKDSGAEGAGLRLERVESVGSVESVTRPEPVYKGSGGRFCTGSISLSGFRTGVP